MPHAHPGPRSRRAFTIIELLTVIAVIAILASILFPLVGKANENAKKAKTKVQFSQWASAIEAFRREYGFYPNLSAIADDRIDSNADAEVWVQTLSGRKIDGTLISGTDPGLTAGNKKKIAFYSFGAGDLTSDASPLLQDAFGNTQIVVLLDKNYDGFVKVGTGGDYTGTAPTVNGLAISSIPTEGVRTGVILYSAGAGNSASDIVTSW